MVENKISTEKNPLGYEIRRWCSSCKHKVMRDETTRYCSLKDKLVGPCYCCSRWEMSKGLQRAGLSQGRVKRPAYLNYLLRVREDEEKGKVKREDEKPLEEIQAEFEKEFGSIYLES